MKEETEDKSLTAVENQGHVSSLKEQIGVLNNLLQEKEQLAEKEREQLEVALNRQKESAKNAEAKKDSAEMQMKGYADLAIQVYNIVNEEDLHELE